MSISEKLKNTLSLAETQNVRKHISLGTNPNSGSINYRSKGIPSIPTEQTKNKLNDIINNMVKKIKKTPYWNDYSAQQQEEMICKYFDAKITRNRYSQINFSLKDKAQFIENVLKRLK